MASAARTRPRRRSRIGRVLARVVVLLVVLALLLAVATLIFLVTLPDVSDAELRIAQVLALSR